VTGLVSRRSALLGGGALFTAGAFDALVLEPHWLDVSEHDVAVPGLPRSLDGFTIAQITDAHLTRLGVVEESIVREIERRDVQLVALTGDIVDGVGKLGVLRELCAALTRTRRTVLATLGNWEHWGEVPIAELGSLYSAGGAELLINESRAIGAELSVVATDDSTAGGVALERAMAHRAPAPASLLLTHSPELLDRIPAQSGRFDLALAGHTHGGQITLASHAPLLPPGSGRFVAGWYDVPVGKAYVSRGTGTSIAPARFMCRPELPLFTLRQG
jgi:uncharacterized protein